MSRVILFLLACMAFLPAGAQQVQTTFEMRYFTKDPKADGSTDFHGETEWLDTKQQGQAAAFDLGPEDGSAGNLACLWL